jgi:DNA helicase-2/ATP-dependent DNA helicase PcrA
MTTDRTRRFALPGIDELNKDQDAALALPMQGQSLIIGGPGTGKSVVALLRARRLNAEGRNYLFLVYNQLLDNSNRHLFGNEQTGAFKKWETWFRDFWHGHFRSSVPLHPVRPNSTYRAIDWAAVKQRLQGVGQGLQLVRNPPDLVIDEGQDMPEAFYSTLAHLGFENFYVVADQNQQITQNCSSRQDIENALAIAPSETLELQQNYRNTRPIAQLARHFYPANPASPRPDLPDAVPTSARPELWTYGVGTSRTLPELAVSILQMSDRSPRKLVGIIAPNNLVRTKFFDALEHANPSLDNDKPPVRTYASGDAVAMNFDQGGIMVVNAQSCKGLEFDITLLADIDEHQPKHADTLKARFYVMASRARDHVLVLRTGPKCPIVDTLLPSDPEILFRK